MCSSNSRQFGDGDTSLVAMGGPAGVADLVQAFYTQMETLPVAQRIRDMHPDLALAREKLTIFLIGWLGGPKQYAQRWGPIRIPPAHAHLPIDEPEHDAWIRCMDAAIESMPVTDEFRVYFKREIRVPAARVMRASKATRGIS